MSAAHLTRRPVRITVLVAVVIAVLAAALPGAAAAVNGLPADPPLASCQSWQDGRPSIVVSAPNMNTLGNMGFARDMGIVVNPTQDVAYRVTIVRSNGSVYTRGPWMVTDVNDWTNSASLAWRNLDTNTWEYNGRTFFINEPGVFWVYVNYYWYANQYFGSANTAGYLPRIAGGTNGSCRFYPEEF